jgi:predicted metal-dependent phosphoesterase TrpH
MSRPVSLDPHVHTSASRDSTADVETVLGSAERAGLDAVAVTDHDTMAGARRALEFARSYEVVVIPGVAVSTADGHLLALGVTDRPEPDRSLARTVEVVRRQGGAAVVPHPFQRSRHGVVRSAFVDCDGLEVSNAMAMTGLQNRRSRLFARRHDYPQLGGSDAHTPAMVGRAHTLVRLATETGPVTPEAVVSGIRAGRTDYAGGRVPLREALDTVTAGFRRRLRARLAGRRPVR